MLNSVDLSINRRVPHIRNEESEAENESPNPVIEFSAEEKEAAAKVKQEVVIGEKEADEEASQIERMSHLYFERIGFDPVLNELSFKEAAIFHLINLYHELEIAQKTCTPLNSETHVFFLTLIVRLAGNKSFNSQKKDAIQVFLGKLEAHLKNKSEFFNNFKIKCFSIRSLLLNFHFEDKKVGEIRKLKEDENPSSKNSELLSFVIQRLFVVNRLLSKLMLKVKHDDLMRLSDSACFPEVSGCISKIDNQVRIYRNVVVSHIRRMRQNLKRNRLDLFHLNATCLPKAPSTLLISQIRSNLQQLEGLLNFGTCLSWEQLLRIKEEEGSYEGIDGITEERRKAAVACAKAFAFYDFVPSADGLTIKAVRKNNSTIDDANSLNEEIMGKVATSYFSTLTKYRDIAQNPGEHYENYATAFRFSYRLSLHLALIKATVEFFDWSLQLCEKIAPLIEQPHLSEEEVDALWLLNDRALSSRSSSRKERKKHTEEFDRSLLDEKEISSIPSQNEKEAEEEILQISPYFSSQMNVLRQPLRQMLRFWPSASQELKAEGRLCLQDAWYHTQILSISVDLYAEMKRINKIDHWRAVMHRFVRSSSIGLEGILTGIGLVSETSIEVNHDFVTGTQECGYWEKLPEESRIFLEMLNMGTVFHRYPHTSARRFFIQNGRPLPKALEWLLIPKKASHRNLDPFIHAMVESLESFTGQSFPSLHKAVDQSESISVEKDFEPAVVSLRKQLNSSLDTLSSLVSLTTQMSKEAQSERKAENWKDVAFLLSSLQKQLNCWTDHPQPAFLASHVDMILTLLQFLDEQTGLALCDEKLDQRFFTHDLAFYSAALNEEETEERERITRQLNIHTGGQYPHRYLSSLTPSEKKALDPSSAVRLRLDALLISQQMDGEGNMWTPSRGQVATLSYEQITERLITLVSDCMAVTKKRFEGRTHIQ